MTDRPDMSGRFFLCPLHACAIAAGDAARNVSTMPRLRLAPGSLARQLGGRHDGGGGGTREGSAGALQGCAASSRFGTACCKAARPRPVLGRHVAGLHGSVPFRDGVSAIRASTVALTLHQLSASSAG